MNILKEGVHTVKDGTIGIGHTLSDGYHNVALAKDKLFRSRPVFDADDEIIGIFEADIKTSLAGLKYLLSQLNHLNRQYWPKLFRANQKIVDTYIKLIGANSLNFKDIDSYYQEFTRWQAEQLTPKVHPKERQFLIESVCRELANYSITMEQLRTTILEELVRFQADVVTPKVKAMMKYLKEILKLIKLRLRKKIDHEKIHKKIAKLMSKTLPLDEKETKELNSLDVLLKQAMGKYNKVNGKLKLILPHAMSFLEEFLELITKLIICKQESVYKVVHETVEYYSKFHGFLTTGGGYDEVIRSWEAAIEPVRIQLESSINIIHDKNPELLDTEMDDEVKKDLKVKKAFKKVGHSLDKKNPVKPVDLEEGVFNEHQVADPLASYEKFKKMEMNQPKLYNPGPISIDDVIVPHSLVPRGGDKPLPPSPERAEPLATIESNPNSTPQTPITPAAMGTPGALSTPGVLSIGSAASTPATISSAAAFGGRTPVPPPLPPRTHRPLLSIALNTPRSSMQTPVFSPVFSPPPPRTPNTELDSSEDDALVDDYDDTASISLASSIQTISSISLTIMDKTTNEGLDRSLVKIYNLSKNSIQESPFILNNALYEIQPSSHRDPILFDETTSISYRIWKFNKFFDELENRTHISKDAIAKYDFKGDKPGDLSFKKGDKLKIIFTFIDEHENDNWLVGISETDGLKRKGFVPSNYLE